MKTVAIEVRQHNGQNAYGPWINIGSDIFALRGNDDVPQWVAGLVGDEIADDQDEGMVEKGGSKWVFRRK